MGIDESKLAELHEDIRYYADKFRRGKISFEEYNNRTRALIGSYYKRYSTEDTNRDSEPKGVLGIVLNAIRKLF
jgi:hypothetical protein